MSSHTEPGHSDAKPFLLHSEDRLQRVIKGLRQDEHRDQTQLPGLSQTLDDYLNPDVDVPHEDFVRRLLTVFHASTTDGTYSAVLAKHSDDEGTRLRQFVQSGQPAAACGHDFHIGPSPAANEELPNLAEPHGLLGQLKEDVKGTFERVFHHVDIYENIDRTSRVPTYIDRPFQNWGRTVDNTPKLTCVPRSSYGVQQIVKYAKKHDMSVRASGYRHSWSPVFGKNGQILVSTLGLTRSSQLPNIESLPGSQLCLEHTELNTIDLVGIPQRGKNRLVRVGTAVTNQQLRRWCNSQKLDDQSTLPLNVIMVEITLGGSNAPICHGAGRRHPSLSDLVLAIEYVDENGDLQMLSKDKDPELMKTASGCFGLLGVVTHLTLSLEPMSYAVLRPQKLPIMKAIPPPPGLADADIPPPLRITMTTEERAAAQTAFEKHARDNFYSEWFWFPYTSSVWVNCWDTTTTSTDSVNYPSDAGTFLQFAQTVLIQIIQSSEALLSLQESLPFLQATLISKLGLDAMPDGLTDPSANVTTQLPNALHFRRAIQNVRVRDMEVEIPLQPLHGTLEDAKFDDEIDFSSVQKAWWDAILMAYKHADTSPQRMPTEMRITGPSEVTLAPYRGCKLGAASIEVLTLEVMKDSWLPYAHAVLDKWMELKDREGKYLNIRPHWAKEWYPFDVRGRPMVEYLRESYGEAIVGFQEDLGKIAVKQGWSLTEARKRFSNDLFEKLFFGRPGTAVQMEHKSGTTVTVASVDEIAV